MKPCPTGKVKLSRRDATRAAIGKHRVYFCPKCRWFHRTSKPLTPGDTP